MRRLEMFRDRRWAVFAALVFGAALLAAALVALTRAFGSTEPAVADMGFNRIEAIAAGPPDAWVKLAADVDGDARPDLVVSGANGPVVWAHNPDWKRTEISSRAATQSGGAAGDVDADGDTDLVIGTTLFENKGRGRSWQMHSLGDGGTHDVVLGDMDGDGKLDVGMRGETASVVDLFFQNRTSNWTHVRVDPGVGRNGLGFGDLDGDGDGDLVVGARWMVNPGEMRARSSDLWTTRVVGDWSEWAAVQVVDVDRDGRQDVVLAVSEEPGDIAWFEAPRNEGSDAWVRHTVAVDLDSVHNIAVVDANDDGKLDVVGSEFRGAGRVMVILNQDHARTWAPIPVAEGDELHNIAVADLNADGLPDIAGAAPFGVQPLVVYRSDRAGATRVLVFSRTRGFRHDSIPFAIGRLEALGAANGFTVDATEDSDAFTTANLARYRAVVFLNPSGDVLDEPQREAFRRYIATGRGFVGVHNAAALVLEDWAWYTGLVGARYRSEVATQPLRLTVVDPTHLSTRDLPSPWLITEEAYNWDVNPKTRGARVLVELDETYSSGGTMGRDHPFSWYKLYAGGRSWYTTGGANEADFEDPRFVAHVLGGIRWAGQF